MYSVAPFSCEVRLLVLTSLLKQRFTLGVFSNSLEELSSQNEGTLTAGFCRGAQLRESLSKPSLFKKGSRAYDRLRCLCHKCVRHTD